MLPPPPPAEPTAEEAPAGAEEALGQLSLQGGGSPTGGQQDVSPAAPIGSAQSGEDFFSALGGAGAPICTLDISAYTHHLLTIHAGRGIGQQQRPADL